MKDYNNMMKKTTLKNQNKKILTDRKQAGAIESVAKASSQMGNVTEIENTVAIPIVLSPECNKFVN